MLGILGALILAALACARAEVPISAAPPITRLATYTPQASATPALINIEATLPPPSPVVDFGMLPANGATAEALATLLALTPLPTPSASPTAIIQSTPIPIPEPAGQYPNIYNLTAHAQEIFEKGKTLGNRRNVFTRVGDSITESAVFLKPIGIKRYYLYDEYAYLEPVIQYFSVEAARENYNSFSNPSLAAKMNWRARALFSPASADPAYCNEGEAPLPCEYRIVKPSIALVMLGTNDVPFTPLDEYEYDMRRVLEYLIDHGVIPVLSTIPHLERVGLEGRSEQLNEIIIRLAYEYDIPLWDYWQALSELPNQGVGDDGVHPTWAPLGHSADFTSPYLDYGMTVRNLMALQVLDLLWHEVIEKGSE